MNSSDKPPVWCYETAQDLDQPLIERLRHFPREPDMLVFALRSVAALAVRAWLRVYHRLEITGRENLPSGSYILVANHSSHLDTLCLLAALPLRKLHRAFPAAAADYFFVRMPRIAVAAILVNALPFDRLIRFRQSLSLCRQLLANPGNILIVFPEGTRSTTGQVGQFLSGIGALLAGTNTPAVPCCLRGTFEAWPKGRVFPRPGKLRLTIGRPRNYATIVASRETVSRISEELRQAVLAIEEGK